jgi:Ras GTPase-activating-like protein IQGAP2/3
MDQYMALSKKDLMIHISLNELYNTHSLILQHIETLVSTVLTSGFSY